jgi:hypothetical protein
MVGRQSPPPPPPRPRWLVVVLVIAGVGALCAGTGVAVHLAHRPDAPLPSPTASVESRPLPAVQPGFKHALAPTLVFSVGPQPSFHPISPMRTETCTVSVTRQGVTSWLTPESLQALVPETDPPSRLIEFYTSIEIELQVDPKYMCDRERTEACTVKVMRCGQPLYVTPALAAVLLPEPGNDGSVPADPVVSVKTIEADAVVAPLEVRPDFVPDYDPRWGDDKADHPLVWRTGTEPELDKQVDYKGPGKVLENGDVLFERDKKAAEAAAKARVRRAPVIPDDLGLGERLVLIDVLVERFGQRRSDLIKWSMDDLVACYWAQVTLSKKPPPFPEAPAVQADAASGQR